MNVLLINGSPRTGVTYNILKQLNERLISKEIGSTLININDFRINTCRGCYNCITKGVEYCPLKGDDVQFLWNIISESNLVVVGSPVYSLGIPGIFKNFMDRIAYNCHRPSFFGKPMINIATTAGMGTSQVLKQLKWFNIMGFKVVGSGGFMIYPKKEATHEKNLKDMKLIDKIMRLIEKNKDYHQREKVRFIKFLQFQTLKLNSDFGRDVYKADYEYYRNKEYYFPTKINRFYKFYGKLVNKVGLKSLSAQFKSTPHEPLNQLIIK
jgi:multimeric flavodoxin WrbA